MRYAECHPDRKHASHGLCVQCYQADWRQKNREHFRAYGKRWREANAVRRTEYIKKWRQENPDKVRETNWRHTGIDCTYAQYKELEAAQSGCCALCGNPDKGRHLAVDHHHNTGRIRGLLCRPCNQAIGVLEKRGVNSIVLAKYLASET